MGLLPQCTLYCLTWVHGGHCLDSGLRNRPGQGGGKVLKTCSGGTILDCFLSVKFNNLFIWCSCSHMLSFVYSIIIPKYNSHSLDIVSILSSVSANDMGTMFVQWTESIDQDEQKNQAMKLSYYIYTYLKCRNFFKFFFYNECLLHETTVQQ